MNYGKPVFFPQNFYYSALVLVVMISIVDAQREILLDPVGTNVWSGQAPQSANSAAVTWSLAKQLYGRNGAYFIIPISLIVGMGPTTIQWLIWKVRSKMSRPFNFSFKSFLSQRWPKIGPIDVESVILPLIYMVRDLFVISLVPS